jgi:hypothetical protein
MMLLSFIAVAGLLFGQDRKIAIPANIANDAYELYSFILKSANAIAIDVGAQTNRTCIQPRSQEARAMAAELDRLANQKYAWEARFKLGHEYQLLSGEEIKKAFSPCLTGPSDPVPCPESKITEVWHLSAPGFNPDHTRALVSVSRLCGGLCGEGSIRVYRKTVDGWKREDDDFATCVWIY